jgi:hypothetical protein
MRISLRELLIGVALVALALVSLRNANYYTVWPAVATGVTMVALFVALIVAVVDRGPRQAFAMGFALTAVAYGLMLLSVRTSNFDQFEGWLPTTRLLAYVHRAVDRGGYYDHQTGQLVPDYDPSKLLVGATVTASYREDPPREVFMPIGHCWWALILGYAGGWFARFVYSRRTQEQNPIKR